MDSSAKTKGLKARSEIPRERERERVIKAALV